MYNGYRRVLAVACVVVVFALSLPARAVTVVEYYHAGFDHYFVTSLADEITKLDNGTFAGWTRTGKQFEANNLGDAGTAATCRFFSTAFGAKSSHFYTPYASECGTVKGNPSWEFEAEVFAVRLPSATGTCPSGTIALYRLYNNGKGGAPNHRYTTELATRSAMLAQGWIPEGAGTVGVIACVHAPVPQTAEGLWFGNTSANQSVAGFVMDNSTFYFVYTSPNSPYVAGVVQGTVASASSGAFTSSNAKDFNFSTGVANVSISGTYASRSTLNGVIAANGLSATFALAYDSLYEAPASLAAAAGTYAGSAGTSLGVQAVTVALSASGAIVGSAAGCSFTGTATRHGATAVLDVSVRFGGGLCQFGTATLNGIGFYDAGYKQVYVVAPNASRTDGFVFIGNKP